jgi:hypothetical protein
MISLECNKTNIQTNIKIMKTTTKSLDQISQQIGLVLMAAAATFGIVELPDRASAKVVVPSQPTFAFATQLSQEGNNPLRREREESAPHYISYSVTQRTPGRTGRF